ncbi:MAG: alcohol dehydrogenase [Devosia sp.]|uniref:NADP-dependent oxidoreductase n=1 Tax=Devosia sp. TaxID=1871048 RepID=UPI00262F905D|nr:NADP-dependent oxidoreductase [Devosia sp.]MDB5531356.1 alcohol dehydrogenase [Devosia sp.]
MSNGFGSTSNARESRQWIYMSVPEGKLTTDIFKLQTIEIPAQPGPGEVLVRNRYLNIMPGNRAYMRMGLIAAGQPMWSLGVGEVLASNDPGFVPGDVVEGLLPWQDVAVVPAQTLGKREGSYPVEHYTGLLGQTGYTAYFGLLHAGQPRAGETVLVSAAAGGVGSLAVQLAKLSGCRIVGIAGGADKCAWLEREVGADATIDYKAGNLAEQLRQTCPDGVDLFFDNVGGPILEAALDAMKVGGRIILCGNASQYDSDQEMLGPKGVPLTLILKNLTMRGFPYKAYEQQFAEAERNLWAWVQDGRIKPFYHVVEGLEQGPTGLVGILSGANRGMAMVRV